MCSRILLLVLCISLLTAAGGCSKSEQPADKKEQPSAAAAPAVDPLQAQAGARAEGEARLAKLLERVVAVLDGYQAFSGQYPQQVEDLNQGGYFFDLAYLADLVAPPEFQPRSLATNVIGLAPREAARGRAG